MRDAGIDEIPGNDFSLYDHVLDTAWMVGAIPERHRRYLGEGDLVAYFAMARGTSETAPLEMTKWFDTNYHYLVPELGPETVFAADPSKPVGEFAEALALGITTRPVLAGPVTFLLLAKPAEEGFDPLSLLDALLPVYADVLAALADAGAHWVQLDEPALVQDRPAAVFDAAAHAYETLAAAAQRPKILVGSYFDALGEALPTLARTPIDGLAVDLTAAGAVEQLEAIGGMPGKRLVAGIVDGRNVWANDLTRSLALLQRLRPLAATVDVAPSCSLLHVPLDVSVEDGLDPAIRPWLAFARQKLDEVVLLARGLNEGGDAIAVELAANEASLAERAQSPLTRDDAVRARAAAVSTADVTRHSPYPVRHEAQQRRLGLPLLPITTIGSFPQTRELRRARADRAAGRITPDAYDAVMAQEVKDVIALQENLGLDVLVHGEPERNDMVQYFAEQLAGFAATRHGWVQSYGTRFVRPPIIVGDVSRPAPMTVDWTRFAQQQTSRPVKGMLTGGGRCRDRAGRRTGAARDAAVAARRAGRVPGVGGGRVPPGDERRRRRHASAYPHVLRRVRRRARRDHRHRRGRDQPGGGALGHGDRRRAHPRRLPARGRPGRVGHPLTARPVDGRGGRPAAPGRREAAGRAAVGSCRSSGCGLIRTAG